jgi:hypothetical protein
MDFQGNLFLFLAAVRVFFYICLKLSRPAVWPTQFPLQCVDGVIFTRVRHGAWSCKSVRSVPISRISGNVLPLHHVPSCGHANNCTFTFDFHVRYHVIPLRQLMVARLLEKFLLWSAKSSIVLRAMRHWFLSWTEDSVLPSHPASRR